MTHLLAAVLAGTVVVALTFFPFVPGDHDPLAVPLSTMALVFGWVALLLVPIGGLWLWASGGRAAGTRPPRWLIRVTVGACAVVALAMTLMAWAAAGVALAAATAAAGGLALARLFRRLQALPRVDRTTRVPASVWFVGLPVAVLAAQLTLVAAVTTSARNRIIANSAMLIADIERHRAEHGKYPVSLLAVWGDYKPSSKGVERYEYELSGSAYNVIFEEPSLVFGTQKFVVYNPRDEQSMTSHAEDRLQFDGPALEVQRGYYAVRALPQPHWKVFEFD